MRDHHLSFHRTLLVAACIGAVNLVGVSAQEIRRETATDATEAASRPQDSVRKSDDPPLSGASEISSSQLAVSSTDKPSSKWWQRSVKLPLWSVIGLAILAFACIIIAFYFGFWRGSTLPVRALATMALIVATGNIAIVSINNWLRIDIAQLDGKAYLLLALFAICFTLIELVGHRPPHANPERQREVSMQALLLAALDQWIDEAFPANGADRQLRKSIVRAIVTMDYPDDNLLESPSIRWPNNYDIADKWRLSRSVWKSLQQHKDALIARMEADFHGMIVGLREALNS